MEKLEHVLKPMFRDTGEMPRLRLKLQLVYLLFFIFLRFLINLFLEIGEGREKEGEKHQYVVASRMPPTEDLAHNPGMCLTGNQTGNPLVCRPALNPLSHTSQGAVDIFIDFRE